jgi:hypothetical protein
MIDASVYNEARAAVASMLNYADLNNLSAEQATRLDIATALRLAVDDQSGKLARGETADVSKLLSASEALAKLLPPLREPPPPTNREDPRDYMWRTYSEMRARGALHGEGLDGLKLTVEKLQAELAAKDARIGELEAALAGSVPLPPNAVKLRNDNPGSRAPSSRPAGAATPAAPPPPAARPFVNGTSDLVARYSVPDEPWRQHTRIDWEA